MKKLFVQKFNLNLWVESSFSSQCTYIYLFEKVYKSILCNIMITIIRIHYIEFVYKKHPKIHDMNNNKEQTTTNMQDIVYKT